jgi:hypothetical protein
MATLEDLVSANPHPHRTRCTTHRTPHHHHCTTPNPGTTELDDHPNRAGKVVNANTVFAGWTLVSGCAAAKMK